MIVNAGHPEGSEELERVLTAGLRTAFPHAAAYDITDLSTLLVAGRAPAAAAGCRPRRLPSRRPVAALRCRRGGPAPGGPRERAYTDDRAPVEWLIDRSIVSYAAGESGD